jgi:hypothetical protein
MVDIADWVFTLPDAEYQRCSPAHIAAGFTTSDDGRRMSLNVETIGGHLMVQHYVEDVGEKHHVRLLSTSDVITPTGRTKSGVVWELGVKRLRQLGQSAISSLCWWHTACRRGSSGPALRMFPDWIYEEGILHLNPGD